MITQQQRFIYFHGYLTIFCDAVISRTPLCFIYEYDRKGVLVPVMQQMEERTGTVGETKGVIGFSSQSHRTTSFLFSLKVHLE